VLLGFVLNVGFFSCIWGKTTLLESARDAPSILFQGASAGPPHISKFLKVLDPGGAAWQTEPYFAFIRSEYSHLRIPLWNPYQGYGKPMAANMQSQPFYPLTLALSIRLTPRTYSWYVLLRLFLAGFFGYLYFRFFVSFPPALGGGIAVMLAGYYILFITMPHLSVETLLPAAFYAGERLVRRRTYGAVLLFASVLLFVVLGGMPESALLLLAFLYTYLVLRIVLDPELRQAWRLLFKHLVLGSLAGVALSAFLLLPFYEYARISWTSHTRGPFNGLVHDSLQASIFSYLFPLLFGPPHTTPLSEYTGLRNYFGVICFFLVLISVIAGIRSRRGEDRLFRFLTYFFFASIILVLCKRYGLPGVNALGSLPMFRLINFQKYEEPILSFCVAALCALGLERLRKGRVPVSVQISAFCAAFLMVPSALVISRGAIAKEMHIDRVHRVMPEVAIGVALVLLVCLGVCIVVARRQRYEKAPAISGGYAGLPICVLILLTAEALLNFIIPLYHVFNKLPLRADNPYVGAPYVDFLKRHDDGLSRIFGRNGVLVPNWASVFQLSDIRDLDAMYYKKYFPFLDAFFPSRDALAPDLESCFRGFGPYDFTEPLERRLLQLSSVRYILSIIAYAAPNARIEEVLHQNKTHPAAARQNQITRRDLIIDGIAREAFVEHPPYQRLPYKLKVGSEQSDFHFSYALDPAVFNKPAGDGVGFTVEVNDASGRITKVFSDYIDPKHNVQQRRWSNGEIDLTRYRGQEIELLFSTDPGPKGNTTYDWAVWSNFHFDGEQFGAEQPFRGVYQNGASVYQYDNVLPRAALYFHTELERTDTDVLRRLADPTLDIFKSVVLDESKLTPSQVADAAKVNRGDGPPIQAATITSYQPQAVDIEASLDRDGILVLNDSGYPGWVVNVDGQRSQWFAANYMFRGVFLKPGRHRLRFIYRPRSFYMGAAISSVAVLCIAGFGLVRMRSGHERKSAFGPPPAIS
jgi:hypothetical protein